ncbi:methyl-accepting chemotaxis protein [Sporolactobacillus terrae]|nr:methyl-accepting chemotaxis protein [Sporolactobacillus terrae]
MKEIKTHLSLKVFLAIFFVIVIIVPDILIGGIIHYTVKNSSQKQMNSSTENSLKLLDKNLTQFFEGKIQMVATLSKKLSENSNLHDSQLVLGAIQAGDQDETALYLANRKGDLTFLPSSVKIPKTLDSRTRPWYKLAMKNPGHPVITPPYRSSDGSNAMTVTIAQTTSDEKAVIGMDLKLSKLNTLVNQVKLGDSGYAFLLDGANTWVVNKNAKVGSKASTELVHQFANKTADSFTYQDQNVRKIINKRTGWTIGANINRHEIDRIVNPLTISIVLIILIKVILIVILAGWLSNRYFLNPFKIMVRLLDKVSNNDLSEELDTTMRTNKEFTQLSDSVNKMIHSLKSVMKNLSGKSETLAASSEELTASTEESKATTDEIAHSIEQIAVAAEQQTTGIKKLTQNAEEINQSIASVTDQTNQLTQKSQAVSQVVEEGQKKVTLTSDQMGTVKQTVAGLSKMINKLSRQSEEIDGIIHVINDVTEQTQLLSLNASIEAARAGEQGKGFAVVAHEIQKLSAKSSGNADKISAIVATIQEDTKQVVQSMKRGADEVEKGIGAVKDSNQSFEEIRDFVNETISEIETMSKSIQKVADFTKQSTASYQPIESFAEQTAAQTQQVSAATEQQAASIEDVAKNSTELSKIADELNQIAQSFKLEKSVGQELQDQ